MYLSKFQSVFVQIKENVFFLFSSLDLCLCRGDFELCMLLEMDHHGKDIVSTSKFYFGDRHVRKCKNVINIVTDLVQVFGCCWWWWWFDLCRWLWTLKPLHQPSKACLSLEIESFRRRRKHIWLSITGIWLGIIDCQLIRGRAEQEPSICAGTGYLVLVFEIPIPAEPVQDIWQEKSR